jgi:hypothetical protein
MGIENQESLSDDPNQYVPDKLADAHNRASSFSRNQLSEIISGAQRQNTERMLAIYSDGWRNIVVLLTFTWKTC